MNMAYCRFHNTEMDMDDCLDALREESSLSASEKKCAVRMFNSIMEWFFDEGILDYDEVDYEETLGKIDEHFALCVGDED